jgi:hypothetical protein
MDTSFIVEAYESITSKPVAVKITKTENITTGLSAGFINAGASTNETKEFPITSRIMCEEIKEHLNEFTCLNIDAIKEEEHIPDYFWINGRLTIGLSQIKHKEQITDRDEYFILEAGTDSKSNGICLITNDVYFSTGYDQLLKHARGTIAKFSVPVKVLVKVLSIQKDSIYFLLCAPMIIEKTE